jgi:hypothetical protein
MTADPVLPGDTLHQHHYSAKEGNMRPSFIIAVCVAAFLAACQSVPVTADYAKTSGKTALFYLIPSGNVTTIKLLLDKGAKIDMSDNAGDTPLLLAKRLGQQAVIDLLEQKNVKPM